MLPTGVETKDQSSVSACPSLHGAALSSSVTEDANWTGAPTRGEVVVQDESALGVAAEQDTGLFQGHRRSRQGAFGDGQ